MNPRFHDEFVSLCALFYSGELSDEEWALLQVHMAYCDSCRRTFEEFKHVAKEVIPSMAVVASSQDSRVPQESAAAFDDAQRRLLEKVEAQPNVTDPQITKGKRRLPYWGALAACLAALLLFAAWQFTRTVPAGSRQTSESTNPVKTRPVDPVAAPPPTSSQTVAVTSDEEAQLRTQLDAMKDSARKSDSTLAALQQDLRAEQEQRKQVLQDKDSLSQQLTAAQASLQELHEQLASNQASSGQQAALIAALESKVRNLNGALEEASSSLDSKDRMLALDKDFLAHDKDIRDLIGARNLYIADIYDTTETGKTAKPFGRIFYTQDRSLVFYGFDLEKQGGLTHSVAFQAWGSGADRQPVSLGLFYQDDSHKRWVVRCDDAKTLARLNMVFVTIEPPGGSSKPTGKQLLRAYLQIQPNHP